MSAAVVLDIHKKTTRKKYTRKRTTENGKILPLRRSWQSTPLAQEFQDKIATPLWHLAASCTKQVDQRSTEVTHRSPQRGSNENQQKET